MRRGTQHDYPIENIFNWGYIEIPLDWTPAQADEMVSILGRIEEQIWILYGDDLVDLACHEAPVDWEAELTVSDLAEDDIPF
jgi:hypothetical protein